MKKLLTTIAVLTAFATPTFAQSFDPDNGTGQRAVAPTQIDRSRERRSRSPPEWVAFFRHGSGTPRSLQFEQSSSHRRWKLGLQ